jgi:hypothetical protein
LVKKIKSLNTKKQRFRYVLYFQFYLYQKVSNLLAIVICNGLIVFHAAKLFERANMSKSRQITFIFIVSNAFADLLIGIAVVPFAIWNKYQFARLNLK